MCGILGSNFADSDKINFCLESMEHRGPDYKSSIIFDNIKLGSVRLAIQDLTNSGKMPMKSLCGNYVIVFNGEIYNFKELTKNYLNDLQLKSNSDTEVVLELYSKFGGKTFELIEGMFSLAIYNIADNKLILARDRSGEKPLYIYDNENGFSFSSKLDSLIQIHPFLQIDRDSFQDIILNGFCEGNKTLVKDITQLSPGTYLEKDLNTNKTKIFSYFEIKRSTKHKAFCLDEFENLIEESIKKMLVSDVPVGILLSGGVDSSIVAYYAKKHNSDVKLFHVKFPGSDKLNELKYARAVADYLNSELIVIDGQEISFDYFMNVIDQIDDPINDSSIIPTSLLFKKISEHGVKVVLGGDGGDELFAGYKRYNKQWKLKKRIYHLPKLLRLFIFIFHYFFKIGYPGRHFLETLKYPIGYQLHKLRLSTPKIYQKLTLNKFRKIKNYKIQSLDDYMYYDFKEYLQNDILKKVDKASMIYSIESRSPFLSKQLIEYAFSLNSSAKTNNYSELKYIPKTLANKIFKNSIDFDRKQGFSFDIAKKLREDWRKEIMSIIPQTTNIFNKHYVSKLLKSHFNGADNSALLFSVIILSRWIKRTKIKF